ncbi:DUF4377 domain-containing protein [Psychrobacter sp. WY6]|uniref:DUF4377 domain-containing protein n=1 Tax=Psychrobacter sp. WY6 TaxID=2708350 RepID=UPI0032E80351
MSCQQLRVLRLKQNAYSIVRLIRKNTPLNGNIQGFTYEPNYRYILDVRQEVMMDENTNMAKPVWILNEVVSKTAE